MKMDSSEVVSCVVCEGKKEKESLSKCFIGGFNTLIAEADALGLNDLSSRVNQRSTKADDPSILPVIIKTFTVGKEKTRYQ